MFLPSYEQVVEFKKAGTATLFLQLASSIFTLAVYALLRVFPVAVSHITVIDWTSVLPVCLFFNLLQSKYPQR